MKARILIVDDEPAILDNIQYVLEAEGLETIRLSEGLPVPSLLASQRVDLILLDIGLPDIGGLDLFKVIRKTHQTPIIFLTARTGEIDRVVGLEIGADDYISKPFSPRELSARVKAVLRRMRAAPQESTSHLSFSVNESKRQISYDGRILELSRYEYEILSTFIHRPGHVFSREELMATVWEQPETSLERSVDAHIKNIRAKLKMIRPDRELIVTHRGVGYSMKDD
ncbi:MAG TPA: two-component system response regulator CreB [Candidatus Polarisedimenticolia bacterium]